ncbi:hypothetical protein [Streptomyces sp. MUM 16J]|uniref:hypothetical protein n=1 Tax=Streptomyces sp. MUM 16J TaxID=2791988 RepID=UPI001F0337EE|nr:hypothetical protein [Streptomyces sp. MUM 16J]MCH0555787.1 hypothetical protein [Streptomyces sp. MUM 16J]
MSTSPEVTRTLAAIEAAKKELEHPEVRRCLDAIAALIKQTSNPDAVLERVLERFAAEELLALAGAHGLHLFASTEASVDVGTVTALVVFWPSFAIVPHGQKPTASLAQLRAAIAARVAEQQLAADFQASVAAGHTENVDDWYARTTRAAQ